MVARQQALLHPAGDHFTLINVFNAFHQRECLAEAPGGQRASGKHSPHPLPPFPLESDPESWCRKHAVSEAALQLAGAVRTELLDVMQRIELPVSPPAFGSDSNILQLKRALLTGFFLKVEPLPQHSPADG